MSKQERCSTCGGYRPGNLTIGLCLCAPSAPAGEDTANTLLAWAVLAERDSEKLTRPDVQVKLAIALREAAARIAAPPAPCPYVHVLQQPSAAPGAEKGTEAEKELEGLFRFLRGEQVGASTDISDSPSYGYGALDNNGFWECPVPAWVVERHQNAAVASGAALRALVERWRHLAEMWSEQSPDRFAIYTLCADELAALAASPAAEDK